MRLQDARKDLLAGAIFAGFGLAFAVTSSGYEIGTPLRMGPGFFPLALGGILVVLGVLIAVSGVVNADGADIGTIPWRALTLLIAAILLFGFTVRDLGLVPALFLAVLLAAFAGRGVRPVQAVVIAASLTALSVLIFVQALQLRLALVGPWLGG
jgi:Tripartite tricarboxylate transporter TctB family